MVARLDVVVFTYNHEFFVSEALRSVLAQVTSFDIAIRIHDDASTDNTIKVIEDALSESAVPWTLTRASVNRFASGIGYFQEFIAASRSEFVAILDGDDFWTDVEKLQRQVDLLDRLPAAAICHHSVSKFADGVLKSVDWPPSQFRQEIIPGIRLSQYNLISTSSVVLRMAAFPSQMPPGFDQLRIGDYPMWSLTSAEGYIAFIERSMSAYRVHDANMWASLESEGRFDQELEARIYISNNVPAAARAEWRAAIVASIRYRLLYDSGGEEIAYIRSQLERRSTELEAARAENRAITRSLSWRLTRPLRLGRGLVRRIARLRSARSAHTSSAR